jgi:hypothetical protein
VATLVARNASKVVVGSGRVCFWQESGFSHHEDVFTFNVLYLINFVLSVQFAKIMLE